MSRTSVPGLLSRLARCVCSPEFQHCTGTTGHQSASSVQPTTILRLVCLVIQTGLFKALCVQIDTWSAGCVITEMLLGHTLFPGESGVDQLVEIIKVTPAPCCNAQSAPN